MYRAKYQLLEKILVEWMKNKQAECVKGYAQTFAEQMNENENFKA